MKSSRKQQKTTAVNELRKFLETKSKRELVEINIYAFQMNDKMNEEMIAIFNITDKYTRSI